MQGLLLAGRYRLVDSIGSGGMGRVWRAHDEVLHRAVAVKELTAALYVTESDRPRLLARTNAEARAAARINHSAVVTVHDVLEHDNRPWIVMELVEGGSLADAVKERGRVEPAEAARIGLWVLRGLRAAHSAGVLHRDVKPGNVLLATDGRVLLTDFGIAQVEGDTTITRTGEIVGSVDYLAPERVRGHDPGPSSDLWALGATLYAAVEGKSPFRRTSPLSTMQAVVGEEPGAPQYAGALAPVITALLRKEPAERPGSDEAEQMLAEAAEGRRPREAQAYVGTLHGELGQGNTTTHVQRPYGAQGVDPADATPRQPVTGPAFATASAAPAVPRKRRRGRTAVIAVVLAALVGGGGVAAMKYADDWNKDTDQDKGGTATSTHPGSTSGAVPDNWVPVTDPVGFGLSLPKGWKRQVYGIQGDLKQIDYTPDRGKHFIRIAIDDSPDFSDPYQHQIDLEQQLTRLADYKRVRMEVNTYRDRGGSLWEYTWTALAKDTEFPGPRRAIEETYVSRDGVEYAIYMSSPAEDWATTRKQFTTVLQSWRPKSA
ncbi:serine/threonine-protein kinase [Streptomyces avermitilis]